MRELLPFVAVAALVIVTPGPDTAVTLRSSLLGGWRAGAWTAVGVATGQLCWTLAAAGGITALLLASQPLFLAVKIIGAAYLVYLGASALRVALAPRESELQGSEPSRGASLGPARAYRHGLLSDLGSPKMAAFFTSLLPQFVPGAHPAFWSMFGLGAVFVAMTLVWLLVYAVAVARAAGLLQRSAVRRAVEGTTGCVLIALGVRLATESRR